MAGGGRIEVLAGAVAAVGAVLFFLSFPEFDVVSGTCPDRPGGPAIDCVSLIPTYLRLAGLVLVGVGAAAALWGRRPRGAEGAA